MKKKPKFETITVEPGAVAGTVQTLDGIVLPIPEDWEWLPPGDAFLTRRVNASGPSYKVQQRKGRKVFSRGVYAQKEIIQRCREDVEQERSSDAYQKRLQAGRERQERAEQAYSVEFAQAIMEWLAFAPCYREIAKQLAEAVAKHATPVGSGTVARTKRIAIEDRAEAAVIAWMRHQTTGYDNMLIPRIKGERRETRRQLAQKSRELLQNFREGKKRPPSCPLLKALGRPADDSAESS